MKPINKTDINDMNGLIMELPAFKDLKSAEGLHNILNRTLEDIYINQTKELMEYMRYNLNERMTETILSNYGIDKNYSKKINSSIKRILVFYIERLFQTKGSREILSTFAEIFGNFFEKINFYNIIVDKVWSGTSFEMTYSLSPISIADKENQLTHIDDDIQLSSKYLMTLEQYKDYKLFPINTNLVYIQFSGGISAMNNMNTFSNGIRAYGATALQRNIIEYPVTIQGKKEYIDIAANHIELLVKYFQVRETRVQDPNFECISSGELFYTDLTYDLDEEISFFVGTDEEYQQSALDALHSVLHEYSLADYKDRKEMARIKRIWQTILRVNSTIEVKFNDFESFDAYIRGLYPSLIDEFDIAAANNETLIEFYMELYTMTLRFFDLDDPYLQLYVNTIFMQVIAGDIFVENFFNPVFEIFVKYFFPVEMEYLNELVDKMIIKDKWNTISTDELISTVLRTSPFSLVTPQRGLDTVYTRMTMIKDPVSAYVISGTYGGFIHSTLYENRIDVNTDDTGIRISYVTSFSDSIQEADSTFLELKSDLSDNNYTFDNSKTELNITDQENINTSEKFGSELSQLKNDSVSNETKQMIKVGINAEELLNNYDLSTFQVNYGDYNDVNLIGDYERNLDKLNLEFGLAQYGYWCSQQEQKYTYNKYLYFKSTIG